MSNFAGREPPENVEKIQQQRKHLNTLFNKQAPEEFNGLVEKHREDEGKLKYGTWREVNNFEGLIDERSILPNEIVIDIDEGDTEERRQQTQKVVNVLKIEDIPHFVAYTGGTGFHIHLIFEIPNNIEYEDIRHYRQAFFDYLKTICEEKMKDVDTDAWDDDPVAFDVTKSNGHLIRCVGGRKIETGNRKTIVSKTQLEAPEIEDIEEVDMQRDFTADWVRINKLDDQTADLTWKEITERVEERKEEEKEAKRKLDFCENKELSIDADHPRNLPVHKVLTDLVEGYENVRPGDQIKCPIHDDKSPSAKIATGEESKYLNRGELVCFSNTCKEKSKVETPSYKKWNARQVVQRNSDIETRHEAIEYLCDNYNLEIPITPDKERYLFENEDGNMQWNLEKLENDICRHYEFKATPIDGDEVIFVYENKVWKEKGETIIRDLSRKLTEDALNPQKENALVKRITSKNRIYPKEGDFEMPKNKVPFKNGVFDVDKQEFEPHHPKHNFTVKHNVEYIQDLDHDEETAPERFIDTLVDTQRKKRILMEVAGLALLPDFPLEKGVLMYGKGSNGKNQFYQMLTRMTDAYHTINLSDMTNDQFAMIEFVGKFLGFFDEVQTVDSASKVKEFSGKSEFRVRPFHGQGYIEQQRTTPLYASNELPNPPEQTTGFFRRFEILTFPYRFTSNEDDAHKDKIPKQKIEEEYWNQEELNKFATKCVHLVKQVKEQEDYTDARTPEETRQIWNNNSSPEYTFLELFVENGRVSDGSNNINTSDFVLKDDLLDLANIFMEETNNSKVRKQDLSRALNNMNGLEVNDEQTKTKDNGETGKAYIGIKISDPSQQDTPGGLPTSLIQNMAQKTDHLDSLASKWVKPTSNVLPSQVYKVVRYLYMLDNYKDNAYSIHDDLDIEPSVFGKLTDYDFIQIDHTEENGFLIPTYGLSEEKLTEFYKDHEEFGIKNGSPIHVKTWLENQASSWTVDTQVHIDEDLMPKGKEIGFSENEIERHINALIDQNKIKTGMKPNTLQNIRNSNL